MWIKNTNTDSDGNCRTQKVQVPGIDEPVFFDNSPVQQVTRSVGKALIEATDYVVEYSADSDSE